MTYNFCTLFDKNYAFRGLALYDSIAKYCPNFKLWILCLDLECYNVLEKMSLENTVLVKLSDVEDEKLLEAKANRNHGEYCWTLGSVFTNFVIKNNSELDHITYLDSDIYFYSSPQVLYEEMGNDSVLIIKHNYESRLKYLEARSGIYNVALVIFKNNEEGSAVLEKWSKDCLKWCYNRYEDGKFGDQMYLDVWPQNFKGVCVSKNIGADLAPWNIGKYKISVSNGEIFVDEVPLVFYHTHTLKTLASDKFELYSSFYNIPPAIEKIIYEPYTKNITNLINQVKLVDSDFNYGYKSPETFKDKIKQQIKRLIVLIYFSHKKYD